jgi:hypothetical protein
MLQGEARVSPHLPLHRAAAFLFQGAALACHHHHDHHHHLYTSSSGRPVGCMSILLKQHKQLSREMVCGYE